MHLSSIVITASWCLYSRRSAVVSLINMVVCVLRVAHGAIYFFIFYVPVT
jgi:hypothetical protein